MPDSHYCNADAHQPMPVNIISWIDTYTEDEMTHYGSVFVEDEDLEVGVCVGVPEYLQGNCRAAGGPNEAYITAWYVDSSDWEPLTADRAQEVLDLIIEGAWTLWTVR